MDREMHSHIWPPGIPHLGVPQIPPWTLYLSDTHAWTWGFLLAGSTCWSLLANALTDPQKLASGTQTRSPPPATGTESLSHFTHIGLTQWLAAGTLIHTGSWYWDTHWLQTSVLTSPILPAIFRFYTPSGPFFLCSSPVPCLYILPHWFA